MKRQKVGGTERRDGLDGLDGLDKLDGLSLERRGGGW